MKRGLLLLLIPCWCSRVGKCKVLVCDACFKLTLSFLEYSVARYSVKTELKRFLNTITLIQYVIQQLDWMVVMTLLRTRVLQGTRSWDRGRYWNVK